MRTIEAETINPASLITRDDAAPVNPNGDSQMKRYSLVMCHTGTKRRVPPLGFDHFTL